ncbi:uncharacterized protein A4U43_C06F12650 [Asparagus officinalis]|uniref:Uncharacterized protein n=1 Tax=Asparagus officinalis TaxID=4686 RepID=A0A5P1ENW9_ASPOF|nr:uncharacterized protein A4U43_C06F12650 [Asparagus officinalis]
MDNPVHNASSSSSPNLRAFGTPNTPKDDDEEEEEEGEEVCRREQSSNDKLESLIWVIETLLVKILASAFHRNRFFDRIQESIFHQYILQTLSGPPLMELSEKIGTATHRRQMSFRSKRKGKGKEKERQEVIDVSKLYKMKQEKVSAWTMKGLVNVISASGLSTISNSIDESFQEEEQREITSEWEAKLAANRIFKNVARPAYKYINTEDLRRFLSREELEYLLPFFEGAAETEEMNILTIVFLKFDNENIYYPNSVLTTKPINNFYRSPDISDAVEFSVDISISVESMRALKSMIKM